MYYAHTYGTAVPGILCRLVAVCVLDFCVVGIALLVTDSDDSRLATLHSRLSTSLRRMSMTRPCGLRSNKQCSSKLVGGYEDPNVIRCLILSPLVGLSVEPIISTKGVARVKERSQPFLEKLLLRALKNIWLATSRI